MKPILILLVALLAGCAGSQPDETYVPPTLIDQEPFPALPQQLAAYPQDFHIKLQIGTEGQVLRAELDRWSGDATWDSLAVGRVMKWRFTPAMYNGIPVKIWIDLRACVKCEEPILMGLGEIVCPTHTLADSLYMLLRNGEDFDRLASLYSIAPSRSNQGRLGEVDIHRFPDEVHHVLKDLKTNEFTSPLAVGSYFCIYKRVPWEVRRP